MSYNPNNINGQATAANSSPIVIASDQSNVPVKQTNASATGSFTAVDAVVSAPVGDGTLVAGSSTSGSIVSMAVPDGMGSWNALIKTLSTGTVYSEASTNSTNGTDGDWIDVKGRRTGTAPGTETVTYAYTAPGYYRGNISGFTYFRLRYVGTYTAGVTAKISTATSVGPTFLNSSIPGGVNVIGKVGIDQTTPGTTNGVQVISALPTGSNTIGAVTITGSQSVNNAQVAANTILTGNGVTGSGSQRVTIASDNTAFSVNAAISNSIPAGANVIGKVSIDQTTPGTTNAVSITNASLTVDTTQKSTYRAATAAVLVAPVTTPAPFLTIYGSSTKTIRIQSIIISGLTLTAVAYLNIGVRKYSTAPSGGTSTSLTIVPIDANSAAGTATNTNAYTVTPTAGTVIGDITNRRVLGQATTAAAAGIPQVVDLDFTPVGDGTAIILRGTAQGIGLYWITGPASAVSLLARIEWTEE